MDITVDGVVGTGAGVFSFDAPVASFIGQNAPLSGRASLTSAGLNFLAQDFSPSLSLGHSDCLSTSWTSFSSLQCMSSESFVAFPFVDISVSAAVGTGLYLFTFDAPILTFSSGNLPSTGGAFVTVFGLRFAANHKASLPHQKQYASGLWRRPMELSYSPVPTSVSFGYDNEIQNTHTSRNNIIQVTRSSSGWDQRPGSSVNDLINGIYDDYIMYPTGSISTSSWIQFEFGSAVIVIGFKSYQQPSSWGGEWQLQGSNDDFASSTTLWTGVPNAADYHHAEHAVSNTESYRYYRLIGSSGTASTPYLHEIEFIVKDGLCQTSSWSSSTALTCHTVAGSTLPDYIALTIGEMVGTGRNLLTPNYDA